MRLVGDEITRHVLSPSERSAIFEAVQFTDVFLAFGSTPTSDRLGIIDKLSQAISGPSDGADETGKTSSPRNFLCEAVVAAKMQCPEQDCRAILDTSSDTGCVFHSRRIAVECKRLRSVSQIEKRVRKACDQLNGQLIGGPPFFDYGLVALEVSNVASVDESSMEEVALREHPIASMDEFILTPELGRRSIRREIKGFLEHSFVFQSLFSRSPMAYG